MSGFVALQASAALNSNENIVIGLNRRIAELEGFSSSTSTSVAALQTSASSLAASIKNTCDKV